MSQDIKITNVGKGSIKMWGSGVLICRFFRMYDYQLKQILQVWANIPENHGNHKSNTYNIYYDGITDLTITGSGNLTGADYGITTYGCGLRLL